VYPEGNGVSVLQQSHSVLLDRISTEQEWLQSTGPEQHLERLVWCSWKGTTTRTWRILHRSCTRWKKWCRNNFRSITSARVPLHSGSRDAKREESWSRGHSYSDTCLAWPKILQITSNLRSPNSGVDEYTVVAAKKHPDGFRHYDDLAQNQTILLIQTGNEDRLSTPISFDSLKHEALPLARNDDMGATDIIRVPLQVDIRFVANLLCREDVAFPEIKGTRSPSYAKGRRGAWLGGERIYRCARARCILALLIGGHCEEGNTATQALRIPPGTLCSLSFSAWLEYEPTPRLFYFWMKRGQLIPILSIENHVKPL
jgi:hypothetical protein